MSITTPQTESDISRNEHDYSKDAKRVTLVADITNAPDGANSDIQTLTTTSVEIGTKAGSRSVGIQVVARTDAVVHLSINVDPATTDHAYLEDNEGVFFPTNLSVYGRVASGTGDVVFWEL
ncbi:MAG: hypothetical protein ABIK92_21785 [Pseudomonadota bacterium]